MFFVHIMRIIDYTMCNSFSCISLMVKDKFLLTLILVNQIKKVEGNSQELLRDWDVKGVKNYNICVCFDKIYVKCCKMCVFYSKVNFITISLILSKFTNFYFYNNKHIINMNTTFTTKHTNFIKINTDSVAGPSVPPKQMVIHHNVSAFG